MGGRADMASRIAKMVKRTTVAQKTRYQEELFKAGWQTRWYGWPR
jgi:hypothetical protein